MEATFRLARQTSRWARFAEVTVRIAAAAKNEVVAGDDAFAWRREVYGPNAWSGGPYDQELLAAAVDGAGYALRCLPP